MNVNKRLGWIETVETSIEYHSQVSITYYTLSSGYINGVNGSYSAYVTQGYRLSAVRRGGSTHKLMHNQTQDKKPKELKHVRGQAHVRASIKVAHPINEVTTVDYTD